LKLDLQLHFSDDYTKDEILVIIRNGRVAAHRYSCRPTSAAPMPSWKHVLSDEETIHIADYLWSKQQKQKSSWKSRFGR